MKAPPRATCAVIIVAIATTASIAACQARAEEPKPLTSCRAATTGITKTTFHGSAARLGWSSVESDLAPASVARGMSTAWTSPPFATFDVNGTTYPGRAYASPLYADGIRIQKGAAAGNPLSVVFVATSNGDVYAISAFDAGCTEGLLKAGTILWQTHLVSPGVPPKLDGRDDRDPRFPAIAVGAVSTPVLDLAASVPVLYVTAMEAGTAGGLPVWKAFALDVATGDVVSGWPVVLERHAVEARNTNAPAYFDEDAGIVSQRSALAISPEGDRLYLGFGGYYDGAVGWLVAIDTRTPGIAASFSGASDTLLEGDRINRHANAGMWAPGGPAVDERGRIYITTGNSPREAGPMRMAHAWGNSMLRLGRDLVLDAVYTPYDYCELDRRDVDIAGSSPMLLPPLDPAAGATTTPSLIAFGGKGGVVYLLDRDRLAPATDGRPPCAARWDDAAADTSLLPLDPAEPYCAGFGSFGGDPCVEPIASTACVAGPLQVFGPPGDDASVDRAKMRTTPAFFRAPDGASYLYVAGATKARRCALDGVPPSLVRLRVAAEAGKPAHLVRDAADGELRFVNPGSPIVSSDGGRAPIVWVVDQNARRTDALLDPSVPGPVLYAVDGLTMKLLWRSATADLEKGGKYVTPIVAHGTVFVATDRLHAFTAAP